MLFLSPFLSPFLRFFLLLFHRAGHLERLSRDGFFSPDLHLHLHAVFCLHEVESVFDLNFGE
jgi:hypothetical protein